MMVRGKVDVENYDISQITEVFVESKPESVFVKQGIIVAKAMVDPSSGTVSLRLLNLTDEHQFLRAKSIAATVDIVQNVISLDSEPPLTDLTPIRSVTESDLTKLPEHLKPVWEASSGSLTEEQKHTFLGLLIKHQDAFAKSKFDLDCTSIVTHKIDTEGHRPIKQAMRR